MRAAKACLLALGLAFVLGCNSLSRSGSAGGTSNYPTPSIVSFSPTSTPQGSPDILLNIEGTHFLHGAQDGPAVFWSTDGGRSGTFLEITHFNDAHITTVIPAASLMSAGNATVQVQIYKLDGDSPKASSNTVTFTVTN